MTLAYGVFRVCDTCENGVSGGCCDLVSVTKSLFFFNFTTTLSNCFVFKFPSVRLQCHVALLLVFVFRVSLFPGLFLPVQGDFVVVNLSFHLRF